jgi:hypothetical protein
MVTTDEVLDFASFFFPSRGAVLQMQSVVQVIGRISVKHDGARAAASKSPKWYGTTQYNGI